MRTLCDGTTLTGLEGGEEKEKNASKSHKLHGCKTLFRYPIYSHFCLLLFFIMAVERS